MDWGRDVSLCIGTTSLLSVDECSLTEGIMFILCLNVAGALKWYWHACPLRFSDPEQDKLYPISLTRKLGLHCILDASVFVFVLNDSFVFSHMIRITTHIAKITIIYAIICATVTFFNCL